MNALRQRLGRTETNVPPPKKPPASSTPPQAGSDGRALAMHNRLFFVGGGLVPSRAEFRRRRSTRDGTSPSPTTHSMSLPHRRLSLSLLSCGGVEKAAGLFRWALGRVLLRSLSLLLLAGCSDDRPDPQILLRDIDALPRKAVPTPGQQSAPTPATYAGADFRSPFALPAPKSRQRVGPPSNVRPNPARKREPLESFALGSLRLVGFVEQAGELFALVQPPTGAITRVVEGSHLGRNHGRVVHLSQAGLEIIEIVPDGMGAWMERRRRMQPASGD